MSDTTFIDYSSATPIVAAWLNDINNVTYRLLGTGGVVPTTTAILRANISAVGTADIIGLTKGGTGQITAASSFDALAPTTTKGDLVAHSSSTNARLAVGTDGQVLKADSAASTGMSWGVFAQSIPKSARTSNTILGVSDSSSFIDVTSGTFTQTFSAAATLGSGWYCFYRNSGTGSITLDPNGSEFIDGLTSFIMYGQESRLIQCDGAAFTSIVIHPFYFKTVSTVSFTMPPGYIEIEVDLVGGGGGGGSGGRYATTTVHSGGSCGGSPARVRRNLRNLTSGASTTVTVGAAGTGGAAQTSNGSDGNNGTAGGNSSFGSLVTAYGGCAGVGGSGSNPHTSGSGSGSAGSSNNNTNGTNGGLPNPSQLGTSTLLFIDNVGEGGGGVAGNSGGANAGGGAEWGGAAAITSVITGTSRGTSPGSLRGVGAASHGGWITATDTMPSRADDAGVSGAYTGTGATGGTCGVSPTAGGVGTAAATDDLVGSSGAGGGSSVTAAASAGGAGAAPGGAGGGGGASQNGFNSGVGGAGATGRAIIKGVV